MTRISSPSVSGGSSAAGSPSHPAESRGAASAAPGAAQPSSPTGLVARAADGRSAQRRAPAGGGVGAQDRSVSRQDQLRQRFSAVAGPRAALPAARRVGHAPAAPPATGSLGGRRSAELGGGPGMMGGDSSFLSDAADELAGPGGGPGMMSAALPALGGTANELDGPGGGPGMMHGHLGAISEHDSVMDSGYEAGASIRSGNSSVDASSFLGGSFVHPNAPLHLNLPMGGGAGDTRSVAGASSAFLIPTAPQPGSPSAPEARSGPVSARTSPLLQVYEANEGRRRGGR